MEDQFGFPTSWIDRRGSGFIGVGSFNTKSTIAAHFKKLSNEEKVHIQRELRTFHAVKPYENENIVRFFGTRETLHHTCLVTELCICSVADLWEERGTWVKECNYRELMERGVRFPFDVSLAPDSIIDKVVKWFDISLHRKSMIRQAAEGVAFLHSLHIVHRNIKARNFLITVLHGSEYVIKLTDMDFSKNIVEEQPINSRQRDPKWPAPELLTEGSPLSIKVDSFSLGWFFYYVFSKGSHPYDGDQCERLSSISEGKPVAIREKRWSLDPLTPIEWIELMMSPKAEDRPTVEQVLGGQVPENVTSGPWVNYFQPDDVYVLYEDNKRPGLCVIYNQFTDRFENHLQRESKGTLTEDEAKVLEEQRKKIRKGTDKDCQSIIETFKAKGFDVKVREDVAAKDLESSITYLGRNWDTKYNSLVICILSHGSEGHVEGVDLNAVKISRLMYCLNSEECRGLNGKPKLFIIQACQGNNRMVAVSEADTMDVDQDESDDATPTPQTEDKTLYHPPVNDIIALMATIPEFVAIRLFDPQTGYVGSVFIQTLCDVLNKSSETNLYDIFHRVVNDMKPLAILEDKETKQRRQLTQTPEMRTSLRKHIKFQNGNPGTAWVIDSNHVERELGGPYPL